MADITTSTGGLDGQLVPVYFKSIRRMAIAFGSIFDNVWLTREDEDGEIVSQQKVPLNYGPKTHWVARINQLESVKTKGTGATAEISQVLPRMSYYITDLTYDATRQRNSMNIHAQRNADKRLVQYGPVPYNLGVSLQVYTKNTEDGLMILEQILPLFAPQINVKVLEIDAMNIFQDITIKLNGVTPEDNWDEGYTANRLVVWTLSFVIEGHIFPPIREQKLIERVIVDFKNAHLDPPEGLERITVVANQFDPPDYDKDNSTVIIEDTTNEPIDP